MDACMHVAVCPQATLTSFGIVSSLRRLLTGRPNACLAVRLPPPNLLSVCASRSVCKKFYTIFCPANLFRLFVVSDACIQSAGTWVTAGGKGAASNEDGGGRRGRHQVRVVK